MAVDFIPLDPICAVLPDGSTGNAAARFGRVKSSGAAQTDGPQLHFVELLFGATTDEHAFWQFRMPGNYASGGTLRLQVKNKGAQTGTNAFIVKAALAAVTPGAAENADSKQLPVHDTATHTLAANQAAGVVTELSIALSATALNSVAAGDWVAVMIGRNQDAAGDTATGDMALIDGALEYTTT